VAKLSSPITDAHVSRLVAGTDVTTLAFYDVSDEQLYGRKHRRRLNGSLAAEAESAGCVSVVFQSVLWWCLAYVPIVPRGVFYVMPCIKCDDPDGDANQYRAIPAQWDLPQILLHYLVGITILALIACGFWYALSRITAQHRLPAEPGIHAGTPPGVVQAAVALENRIEA
jgi:hypothetical protein